MSRPDLGNTSHVGSNTGAPYSHAHNSMHDGAVTASDSHRSMRQEEIMNSSTARDVVDSVVSDIAFGGAIAASDLPRPVGHFMGASSGVSLARMVVDAVLRTGPAAGSPLPERRYSVLEPAMSRPITSPVPGQMISKSYGLDIGMQAALSTLDGGANPQSGNDCSSSRILNTPLSVVSTIDPALSSLNMTRTDYPTSHSRFPAQSMPHPDLQIGAVEGITQSPLVINQRQALDSPSPDMYFRKPEPVIASPVRPRSIPALPPAAAVDRLVQVFVDFVQIMLPILHMPTFEKQLGRVRERSPDIQESDIFFVLMVLGKSLCPRTFILNESRSS